LIASSKSTEDFAFSIFHLDIDRDGESVLHEKLMQVVATMKDLGLRALTEASLQSNSCSAEIAHIYLQRRTV